MNTTIFSNATLIEGTGADPVENATVIVEGERIKEILDRPAQHIPSGATVIDCHSQYLLPGLIDGHVHTGSIEAGIGEQHRRCLPSYTLLRSLKIIRQTLDQGFTTVRDCGGADAGLRQALAEGLICGPRLFISGRILSQTGGHGDFRLPAEMYPPLEGTCGVACGVYDGVDAVRRAAREQLRQGVDFIKVMAGGGCASPADEITSSQYSPEELRAAVFEAESAGKYVAAHCYADRSIILCAEAGVRTIEHGNLMTEAGAEAMRQAGAYLVPTLVTYEVMARDGDKYGLADFQRRKTAIALERGEQSVAVARRLGIPIGSGSDLLGPMQVHKGEQLALLSKVLGPMGAIVATTRTNAEILEQQDHLGTLEAGKLADMILVNRDPLADMTVFQNYLENITLIVQGGKIHKNIL
jgi:imidazolonepropionase-like amidohydrolase